MGNYMEICLFFAQQNTFLFSCVSPYYLYLASATTNVNPSGPETDPSVLGRVLKICIISLQLVCFVSDEKQCRFLHRLVC